MTDGQLPPPQPPQQRQPDGFTRVGDALRRIPRWAWLTAGGVALAIYAVVANVGDDRPTQSELFCSDLRSGLTLLNMWPRDMDPAEFAQVAYGNISTSCPEHLERNRAYFEGWGYTVD